MANRAFTDDKKTANEQEPVNQHKEEIQSVLCMLSLTDLSRGHLVREQRQSWKVWKCSVG